MKRFLYILILLSFTTSLVAQDISIVEDINASKYNEGKICLLQDETINRLLGLHHSVVQSTQLYPEDEEQSRVRGWRIQIFSGNGQVSKAEAESRRARVRSAFPDLDLSISYNAPVWRLRAGGYSNRRKAEEMLAELKRTLPSLANEMYLVQEVLKRKD